MTRGRLILLGVALALALAASASAAPLVAEERVERAVEFLRSAQNFDGGFGEPGEPSDPALSAWVALALEAGGVEAAPLRRGGATLASYLAHQEPVEVTDLELQILARVALGLDATLLVERLRNEIGPRGRIGPRLNSTIWGVLALRAAGERVPRQVVRYLVRSAHRSGGFSFAAKGPPDTNDTAAAIQALRAAGVRADARVIRRAFRYLERSRARGGGYPLIPGKPADAQSTGWVLQAYASAGRKAPRKALRFLVRLQRPDGRFNYRPRRELTPVWASAQALPGLVGRAFALER